MSCGLLVFEAFTLSKDLHGYALFPHVGMPFGCEAQRQNLLSLGRGSLTFRGLYQGSYLLCVLRWPWWSRELKRRVCMIEAPPLVGGYSWICNAPKVLHRCLDGRCQGVLQPHPKQPRRGEGVEDVQEAGSDSGGGFVLTAYGWRTAAEAGVCGRLNLSKGVFRSASAQEWRGALDAYVSCSAVGDGPWHEASVVDCYLAASSHHMIHCAAL